MREKYKYKGLTPGHGKIYEKGRSLMIVYFTGLVRYWNDFKGNHSGSRERKTVVSVKNK